ncbi:MAG: YbaB/EbfC family nucleoid-associated protein [Gammaproteobacteria bacterium]|nr:YbaB/EbfC family nucleoid-associated protein [Gammaproteobacteria bacterium]
MPDWSDMMRQAQGLKARFEEMQKEIAELECTGEAGGGIVRVTLSGQFEARRVQIAPEAMDDREMLEDLVAAAMNDAARRVRETIQERFSGLAGGMGGMLPPGMLPGA